MPEMQALPKVLTLQQVLARLGLRKLDSVLQFVHAGELRAFSVGAPGCKRKTYRVTEAELERFVAARAVAKPAAAKTRRDRRRRAAARS
jgi:hypothetical protein